MKKLISVIVSFVFVFCTLFVLNPTAYAYSDTSNDVVQTSVIEYLDNGDHIETIISSPVIKYKFNRASSTYKSGSKTKNYKNRNGEIMWSVTVYGTFSYNGRTSTCTSASKSTTAPGSLWSIINSSVSNSGNTATARAVARYTSKDYSMSVSLSCSANGSLY